MKQNWKKSSTAGLMAGLMLLSGCAAPAAQESAPADQADTLTIAATTWPVYCFASAVASGAEGVEVVPVVNEPVSCLHDYTLTVGEMKILEGADLILMNGVGFDSFLQSALDAVDVSTVDCSAGIALRHLDEDAPDHDHDHADGAYDPHIWLDPRNAAQMVRTAADALAQADPDQAELYAANADQAAQQLEEAWSEWNERLSGLTHRELITFHDGFGYFADAFDLHILYAIEEEEGSETSAMQFKELTDLIDSYQIPAVFTEVNGSDATAQALSRETGVKVGQLSMIVSGEGDGLTSYLDGMQHNVDAILEALS